MAQDLMEKIKACKTPEELLALVRENQLEMTDTQAEDIFSKLNQANGELSDQELGDVFGGTGLEPTPYEPRLDGYFSCAQCRSSQWGVLRVSKLGLMVVQCRHCGHQQQVLVPMEFMDNMIPDL